MINKILNWYFNDINKFPFWLFIVYCLICALHIFDMIDQELPRTYYDPITWVDVITLPIIALVVPFYFGLLTVKKDER